jgi:hypothetical protein
MSGKKNKEKKKKKGVEQRLLRTKNLVVYKIYQNRKKCRFVAETKCDITIANGGVMVKKRSKRQVRDFQVPHVIVVQALDDRWFVSRGKKRSLHKLDSMRFFLDCTNCGQYGTRG